jgi:molecular chaperone DnaK
MARLIGIDLGTTYSAVAIVGTTGKPEIVPNREGERITPSVVLFQGDQTLVGTMAKRSAPTAPSDVVQFVKRRMGDKDWVFTASDDATYTAEQVSGIILRRLKDDAEMMLGEPVTDAVITVPAFFNDAKRQATMDAATIAGLNVRRIINEPTAAALAFGLGADTDTDGTVLVYDLGGGTFDVTVMRISGGQFDVLATEGDRYLGGFDWDNALMRYINEQVKDQGGPDLLADNLQTADLRDKAEIAKRSLTTMTTTKVFIGVPGKSFNVPVTREVFEELTDGLLSQTCDKAESVLEATGLSWADLDRVLLVGGSTHMPMVHAAVARLSGKEPVRGVNPDEAVALGAAIQAYALAEPDPGVATVRLPGLPGGVPVIHDVSAHGLGALALDADRNNQLANFVLIPRNSRVPCKSSEMFATVEENQRRVEIVITQGDDKDPKWVEKVGESVYDLPPYPKGAPIRVDISYDFDGLIQAEVFDGTTGKKLGDMKIERSANLTPEELQSATEMVRKLEVN